MSKWEHIRRRAREFHSEVCESAGISRMSGLKASWLVERAAAVKSIKLRGLPHDHHWLRGTIARTERNLILFNKDVEEWLALYNQAHEFAHIILGHGPRECRVGDINCEATESKLPFGVHRVEGYGPQERIECEANIFAREFLLPCDVLKVLFIDQGLNAEVIAEITGLGIELVCHQLAYALLTPEIPVGNKNDESEETELKLDDFQKVAAKVPKGPQLLHAGPGTGKTRTLTGRVLHLLEKKVNPENILVLTFSNKAADELRYRINRFVPEAAPLIEVETFHSFGLQLLRKHGTLIGLTAKLKILDPIDALFFLEKSLPALNLDYYQNLYDPTLYLGSILKAISRAKDENLSPDEYFELASKQKACAVTAQEHEAADKVLEVDGVYRFYQNHLLNEKLLDLSDLICRSIELLRKNEKVKLDLQNMYRHVLVDEYQDVNRASGVLLKEIVGDGHNLWVVGDTRQSIHRWRGATTANIRLFRTDFQSAQDPLSLGGNYRSKPDIVDLFSAFAPQMKAGQGEEFIPWEKNRSNDGVTVKFEVAVDQEAEAVGIADEIKRLKAEQRIDYKDQAVICRSHVMLARVAKILEEENVPVLYLGDFFERPEIRDMLSLLSLACEPEGRGLVRVARFPEYDIPLEEVRSLRRLAHKKAVPFPQALALAENCDDISPRGIEKFALLADHLDDLCHGRSAWKTLTRFLFIKGSYLNALLTDETVKGQQQRLALYQLLQFVHSQSQIEKGDADPKLTLLRYIRRLEIYGDEKQLRQSNEWSDGIDAVRILTIHASKGLEFRAVFLPALATTYLPVSNSHQHCPPPHGLVSELNEDWRLEEEECLFFVAMSRACDYICLSRALKYGKVNRKNSSFLPMIAAILPQAMTTDATWTGARMAGKAVPLVPPRYQLPEFFDINLLEVYLKCPRKFMYEFVLGLSGKRDDTAYLQFHKCVYDTVRWAQDERKAGRTVNDAAAQAFFEKVWAEKGPTDHYLEEKYKIAARRMVSNAVRRLRPITNLIAAEREVELPEGRVRLSFDHAEVAEGDGTDKGILFVQRFRTGRPTKKEKEKPIYGLLLEAAKKHPGNYEPRLQILYLGADFADDIPLKDGQIEKKLDEYNSALSGIKNGVFTPAPNEHECNRCPHYFICPAAEEAL